MRTVRIRVAGVVGAAAIAAVAAGCSSRCPRPCPPLAAAPPVSPPVVRTAPPAPGEVFVEASIVRVREEALRERPGTAGLAGGGHGVLDSGAADALLASLRPEEATVVHSPRLLALVGQEASLFVGESADDSEPRSSVEATRWWGDRLRVVATRASDAAVALEVRVASKRDEASPALLADAASDLPSGRTLLLVSAGREKSGERLLALLRARVLRADEKAGS
jgi:hypothetical protein